MVEAAVGILQSASQCLITKKIRDIEEGIDKKFSEKKKKTEIEDDVRLTSLLKIS